jgi:hypothetical protein
MPNSLTRPFNPERFLRFIELDEFAEDWQSLGLDREIDWWNLEIDIMENPEVGDVIPGAGGLRKMRFGRSGQQVGKRSGVRVCYVYFPEHLTVLLVLAYGKSEKADLTAREKKYISAYIERTKEWLDQQRKLKR